MNHILIAEDEHLIARLVEMTLTRAGYRCTVAEDGRTAADLIEKTDFDMAILDIMLPGLDGYDLLASLKPQGVPVIFLTAKSAVKDRVLGLRLGADDYITKPFSPNVLVARIKANLAQYDRLKGAGGGNRSQIQLGSILLQQDSRRVFVDGKEIELKNKEYELLLFLMLNADIVFSKETLYERILGYDAMGDNATVAVHINRLRDKIEKTPSEPRYIQTVWGAGYRFKP